MFVTDNPTYPKMRTKRKPEQPLEIPDRPDPQAKEVAAAERERVKKLLEAVHERHEKAMQELAAIVEEEEAASLGRGYHVKGVEWYKPKHDLPSESEFLKPPKKMEAKRNPKHNRHSSKSDGMKVDEVLTTEEKERNPPQKRPRLSK